MKDFFLTKEIYHNVFLAMRRRGWVSARASLALAVTLQKEKEAVG